MVYVDTKEKLYSLGRAYPQVVRKYEEAIKKWFNIKRIYIRGKISFHIPTSNKPIYIPIPRFWWQYGKSKSKIQQTHNYRNRKRNGKGNIFNMRIVYTKHSTEPFICVPSKYTSIAQIHNYINGDESGTQYNHNITNIYVLKNPKRIAKKLWEWIETNDDIYDELCYSRGAERTREDIIKSATHMILNESKVLSNKEKYILNIRHSEAEILLIKKLSTKQKNYIESIKSIVTALMIYESLGYSIDFRDILNREVQLEEEKKETD